MAQEPQSPLLARPLTSQTLRTPRAAAIAGILFSILMIAILSLFRLSVPADPLDPGNWLDENARPVAIAINLVPFAGIAFLWFLGVLRDRLGAEEDKFFETVFFGSGLLFLGLFFVAAALIGAIILTHDTTSSSTSNSEVFALARALVDRLINIYATKLAAVFIFSTSTVVLFASFASRWLAYMGFMLGAVLLFGNGLFGWGLVALPVWVFAISVCLLRESPMAGLGRQ